MAILAPVTIRADVNEEGLVNMSDVQVTPPVSGDAPSDTGKLLALFGWLTGIVAIIAILIEPYKTEKFVRHHAIQALGFWVVILVVDVLLSWTVVIPMILTPAAWVVGIIGAVKSFQGQYWEVPLVYGLVKKYI